MRKYDMYLTQNRHRIKLIKVKIEYDEIVCLEIDCEMA